MLWLVLQRFALLMVLPHSPERTGDTDRGVTAGNGAEHHGQRKRSDRRDIVNLRKNVDDGNAHKNCDIGIDGTHHGLIDAYINQFLCRRLIAKKAFIFPDTVINDK